MIVCLVTLGVVENHVKNPLNVKMTAVNFMLAASSVTWLTDDRCCVG